MPNPHTVQVNPMTLENYEWLMGQTIRPARDGHPVIISFQKPVAIRGTPIHIDESNVWIVLPTAVSSQLMVHGEITLVHESDEIKIKVHVKASDIEDDPCTLSAPVLKVSFEWWQGQNARSQDRILNSHCFLRHFPDIKRGKNRLL